MRFRLLFMLAAFLGVALQSASAQYVSGENAVAAAVPARKIITWVPPYGIAAAKAQLVKVYDGNGPRNGLTHLALQFWKPTATGGLVRSSQFGSIPNSTIKWFVDWGHRYGIKVLLCVYNGDVDPRPGVVRGWDWSLAQAAIKPQNQTKFINALLQQVTALGLDGIDIDLEGPANEHPADKAHYVAFVRELARRAHLLNKTVTVDTFPYIWNAPNQTWWASFFPHADGINSMGYQDLGRRAPTWQKYLSQKNQAGAHSAKLQIGLPTHLASWQGNTTLEQVQWFRSAAAGRVGIAIWDARFSDPSWRTAAVWRALALIRAN